MQEVVDFERVTALRKYSPRLNPVPPGRVRDGEPGWEPRGSLSGKKGRLVRRNRRAEVCRYPIAHRGEWDGVFGITRGDEAADLLIFRSYEGREAQSLNQARRQGSQRLMLPFVVAGKSNTKRLRR